MGIVGENFKPGVKTQVQQRQKYFAKATKDNTVIQTQNANSWLRLASSVDLQAIESQFKTTGEFDKAEKRVNALIQWLGTQKGSDLAKRFVLTGGTATYDATKNTLNQKTGIGTLAKGTFKTAYGFEGTDFGYRPMPGIESANITYYNNGALARADINIICNSPRQLDALELLYLRPGYTILLEWGHTTYINNQGNSENVESTGYITEPFTQFFTGGTSVDRYTIQDALERERVKKSYNYEGFYGVVTNFSWTLNTDATYKVTIKAITTGAVIESLKIASNFNMAGSPTPATPDGAGGFKVNTPVQSNTSVSQKLLSRAAESDTFTALGNIATRFETTAPNDLFAALPGNTVELDLSLEGLLLDHPPGSPLQLGEYWEPPYGSALSWRIDASDTQYLTMYYPQLTYITFDALLAHLQSNCILYNEKGRPYTRFEVALTDKIPMLSIPGRLSGDPTVCIVNFNKVVDFQNSKPEKLAYAYVADKTTKTPFTFTDEMSDGTNQINLNERRTAVIGASGTGAGLFKKLFPDNEAPTELVGYLGSVHINIEYIASIIDQCADKEGTTKLIDFLQKLLDGVNNALGDINVFKVKYDDATHTVRIYDEALRAKGFSTTVFRSYGVQANKESTIVKNLKITTQLSNEMASMLAIGAQANANTISENATAFSEFNLGLIDRVTDVKTDIRNREVKSPYDKFGVVINDLIKYIEAVYPIAGGGFNVNRGNIETLTKLNKDYCRYIVGHYTSTETEIDAPFIIPFKMSMTIPGLGGATIYQKFGMDDLLLPRSYKDKVEYLIVNMNHNVANNIWETTYDALTIPVPVSSSGATFTPIIQPAKKVTIGKGTSALTEDNYIPDPNPSFRATTIFDKKAFKIGGRPNGGTHRGVWFNSNAYDLHQDAGTFLYAPTNLKIIRVANYGSSITQAGVLKLYGVGVLAQDTNTNDQLYFGHLGVLNKKAVVGATLEKGEFLGTVASTSQVGPHVHIATEKGDLFTNYLEQDQAYNFTFTDYLRSIFGTLGYLGTFK